MGERIAKVPANGVDPLEAERVEREPYEAYRVNLARWGQAWFDRRRGYSPTAQRLADLRLVATLPPLKK
jgi:hypothetical protein